MAIKQFYAVRDELVVDNDLIFKGQQIVIPEKIRKNII